MRKLFALGLLISLALILYHFFPQITGYFILYKHVNESKLESDFFDTCFYFFPDLRNQEPGSSRLKPRFSNFTCNLSYLSSPIINEWCILYRCEEIEPIEERLENAEESVKAYGGPYPQNPFSVSLMEIKGRKVIKLTTSNWLISYQLECGNYLFDVGMMNISGNITGFGVSDPATLTIKKVVEICNRYF